MFPAIKMTDPYSPIARAKARAKPVSKAGRSGGSKTKRIVCTRQAPSVAEASSSSISSSAMIGCTVRTTKGKPIKISAKENQKWKLKPGKTYPGYRLPLFEFLKQEFANGKEDPPNAYDFIAKLKEDLDNGITLENIWVRRYGIDYKIKSGETKQADLKAINQSIGDLIIKLPEDE